MLDNTKYTRTTITIPEGLLWAIKKRAWEERKDFKEVVTEGLAIYLGGDWKDIILKREDNFDINSLFGVWGKGTTGLGFLKKVRYGKKEKEREKYLQKLWKKS